MKRQIARALVVLIMVSLLFLGSALQAKKAYANTTHCGTIGNETWSAGGNVHIVDCDITVPTGITLTIEAGAIVKFKNDAQINVNGKLIAQGTLGNPIYFTSYHDDTIGGDTDGAVIAPLVGDWGHIYFGGGSDDSSIITRAVIRYSGSHLGSAIDDGAIYLKNASPELSYITFTNNYINGVEIENVNWTTDTWDNTTIVYVIEQGDVIVPALNTLTITPGMKIKFGNDADLRIGGKLVASGTIADPIYFSSIYDDTLCGVGAFDENICDTHNDAATAPAVGNWGHVYFGSGSDDSSIITRAVIRYSGSDLGSAIDDGAIYLSNASPNLSNITFSHNYINGVEIENVSWTSDTWDNTTVVYVIEQGDVIVPALNTLTITPGMKIKFGNDADLRVGGKLVASGTIADPIYFSSIYDDTLCGVGAFDENICDTHNDAATAPAVGNWGHVYFGSGSDDSSIITRAVIRYSGSDLGSAIDDGAIYLSNASPNLSNITFSHNYINGVEIENVSWTSDTWDNTTVVYVIEQGDVIVPALNTLTITPGMKIKFGNDADLRVGGKLVASGTISEPVYFSSIFDDTLCGVGAFDENICDTHNDAATAPAVGNWGHVYFGGGSDDSSIITRAVIRYSGSDLGSAIDDGAIYLSNASPNLSNITFSHNYINGVEIENVSWTSDTWDNTTVVYVIEQGDVIVPALNTLTITPGMKIKFGNDADLRVGGKLVASGTISEPVYFSSIFDDTLCGTGASNENICDTHNDKTSIAPQIGNWGGIRFNSGSDDSSLIHWAIIHYSGSDLGAAVNDGAIRLDNASPTINYTRLITNYRGIEALNGSMPTLDCNDIYNNINYGIYNDDPTTPIVIAENQWWGSPSGPPPGKVSSGVDYEPWATTPCTPPPPPPPPPPPLTITNVAANPQNTTATITWNTNFPATSQVMYGIGAPNQSTTETTGYVTSHSVNLTGLSPNTTYQYQVRSRTEENEEKTLGIFTFTTSTPPSTITGRVVDDNDSPISGVTVSDGAGHTNTSDSNGNFALTGLAAGQYTITPAKSGYIFAPTSRLVTVPPNAVNQNFIGVVIPAGTLVHIDPMTTSVNISETVAVSAAISDVTNLGAFEFDLAYDPALISVVDIVLSDFPASTGRTFLIAGKEIDNSAGTASFGAFSTGNNPPGASGSGSLAEIHLLAKKTDTAWLNLPHVQVTNIEGIDIPVSSRNGTIIILDCLGDFDGDGDVDIIDVQLIAYRWNIIIGDPLYDPKFDLNKNGKIDIGDIQTVGFRVGTDCGAPPPIHTSTSDNQPITPAAGQPANLAINPTEREAQVGQTFTMKVNISDAEDLGAFEFELGYDPAIVAVTGVTLGDFPGSTGRNVIPINADINATAGTVSFGAYSLGATPEGPNGSGEIAIVTLRALKAGEGLLNFNQAQIASRPGIAQSINQMTPGKVSIVSQSKTYLPFILK